MAKDQEGNEVYTGTPCPTCNSAMIEVGCPDCSDGEDCETCDNTGTILTCPDPEAHEV